MSNVIRFPEEKRAAAPPSLPRDGIPTIVILPVVRVIRIKGAA